MVPYAGYEMPVQYDGIVSEHLTVRQSAGLFDVSHMGQIKISGSGAESFLNYITVNDVSSLNIGQAQYTAICLESGGIIDDLILYKFADHYMAVTNAANHKKDYAWMEKHLAQDVILQDMSSDLGLIAIQGPKSKFILQKCTSEDLDSLPFYHFKEGKIDKNDAIISRTGYTGELGYELYVSTDRVGEIWIKLLEAGLSEGIRPIGLGARDTLRLEMKYCLYGNDINESTNPIEAGLGWITKLQKPSFIGKDAIQKSKTHLTRRLIAFEMQERAIPRKENQIFIGDEHVGYVTSGTQSPSLKKGIGLGYVDKPFDKVGTEIEIDIRGKRKKAQIIKPPFYQPITSST